MNAPESGSVGHFSANSKSLKSFRTRQKLRVALIAAIIGIPIVVAIAAFSYYQQAINPQSQPVAVEDTEMTGPYMPGPDMPSFPQDSPASQSISTTPDTLSQAMPEGVTVVLNSVEQTGIKSSAYVAADTSAVPLGTSVKVDRASWTAFSSQLGSVNAVFTVSGQPYNGTLTFENINAGWRITGFSISNG